MKTIVWRPGTPTSSIRPTTAQQGRPFTSAGVGTGVQLDGELIASVPDTLVVADAGDVYRQILAWGGDCTVEFDSTLGACTLPAGMVLPGFGVDPATGVALTSGVPLLHLRGVQAQTVVTVSDTAQILGIASMANLDVRCASRTVSSLKIGSALSLDTVVIRSLAGALLPVIITPDSTTLELIVQNGSRLDNSAVAAHPILQLGTSGADPGSTLEMRASMGLIFSGANVITGSAAAVDTVNFYHDASVSATAFATANAVLAGAAAFTDFDYGGAAFAGYAPFSPGNWVNPDPTTIGAALDRIAAVLAAGGGGAANPIP